MGPPPIQIFLTTIASQPALRQRQEYLLRILQVKNIPFTSFDLASDEAAKRLWQRKAPKDKQQLPGILIADEFPGTFQDFEEAVEYGELDTFLRRKEEYKPFADDAPALTQKAIAVPGVATPLQMTPERLKSHFIVTPTSSLKGKSKGKNVPVNKRQGDFDVSTELSGFGLQGVRATDDELMQLVKELGLGGDEAGDLVKGLAGSSEPVQSEEKKQVDTGRVDEKDEKGDLKHDQSKLDSSSMTELTVKKQDAA